MPISVVRFVLKHHHWFDILRYLTIFPVSCVRCLIHFLFRESFRGNFFAKAFLRKAKINFRENTKTKIFVSTLGQSRFKIKMDDLKKKLFTFFLCAPVLYINFKYLNDLDIFCSRMKIVIQTGKVPVCVLIFWLVKRDIRGQIC
jgi:hypothetical protein